MAEPTRYALAYDFTSFQSSSPTTPLPADKIEIEFNALDTTTDEIIDNLNLIQRSDGALANDSVGNDQLKSEVTIGVNAAANWATATAYVANDTVYESNKVYRCLIAHTSDTFSTDLGNSKWSEILDFDQFITAAETAETNAETAETNAETAETNAETAETNAVAAQDAAEAVVTSLKYTFDDTTSMADPGAGDIRLNNATLASVTALAFDATSAESGNPDVSDFIATWDDSTNTVKGQIGIVKGGTPSSFWVGNVTAVTDNTGWLEVTVTHVASNGSFTASDNLYVTFTRAGDEGGTIGKYTMWIPANGMTPAVTNGPQINQIESASNAVNYDVLDFDASTDEYAHFNIAFPKSWDESTVTFQAFWSTTATDTDGVAWGLQAVAIADNDSIDTAFGTAVVVTDDNQSAAGDILVTSESSAITIAGSPSVDEVVFFRLFRDVSDANDDMTEDARLVGIKLFYTTDVGTDD